MTCGGALVPVPKESVVDEAPPRTYSWLETFYRCARCGKLFWEGTHWQAIQARLLNAVSSGTRGHAAEEQPDSKGKAP